MRSVSLPQEYKWAQGKFNAGVALAMDKHSIFGGVELLLAASYYVENQGMSA